MFPEGGFVGQIRGQASKCHSVKGALSCGYALFRLCPGREQLVLTNRLSHCTPPTEPSPTRKTTMTEHPPTPPSAVPEGWYPDPDDDSQYRYWNGSAWTEHRVLTYGVGPPRTRPTSYAAQSHCCGVSVRFQRNRAAFHVCFWVGYLCLWLPWIALTWIALPFLPKHYYCQGCRRSCALKTLGQRSGR